MNKSESKYFNTALLMDEALLLLLEKKDYEFITVTEVCQKAGVNRTTFYLHYESMDDLLLETMGMINKKFNQAFESENINVHSTDKKDLFLINDKYLIPYLNLIKDYKHIYKLIHDKPQLFNNQLAFQKLYENLFSVILDKYGVVKEEKEYIFTYFSFGIVAIIQKWIEKDCVDDIERIVSIIKKAIGYEV